MEMDSNASDGSATSRRGFLRTAAAGTAAAGVAVGASGTATAQEGSDFDGWMSNAMNYDGEVVDETGQDSVTITVGAGNGVSFGPAAVQVDPGTTITWEWSGSGGAHNVVEQDGAFRSGDTVSEQGTTFEQTFEEEGVVKYYCEPHDPGMRGVVVVGDAATGGGGGGEGGEHGGGQLVLTDGLLAMGVALVLGVLSPILFAIHLAINRDKVGAPENSGSGKLERIDSQDD
ncbi:halocyanin domain-containing protein [Halorientalis halophila]|uniref:halocyanin domain-containing protein n=1 Tax=Halorientalis halophila TaxID=3108499 RepID=UPI00300AC22C